jgi:hypothetical protein
MRVAEKSLPRATHEPKPILVAPGASIVGGDHAVPEIREAIVAADPLAVSQACRGTQTSSADGEYDGRGQGFPEAQRRTAPPVYDHKRYEDLRFAAETFEGHMKLRIATANRMGIKKDGAKTKTPRVADPLPWIPAYERLAAVEHELSLILGRVYRRDVEPEIVAWQRTTTGVGEHQLARLLGIIGHPVHSRRHHWEDDPSGKHVCIDDGPFDRRVSDLWSYCGVGDPARKRRKGMSQEDAMSSGRSAAASIIHEIARSCVKAAGGVGKHGKAVALSPYRALYDEARSRYAPRSAADAGTWAKHEPHVYPSTCDEERCKHCDNASVRLVAKAILRDLWIVAHDAELAS